MKQRTKKRQRVTNAINAKRAYEERLALVEDRSEIVRAQVHQRLGNLDELVAKIAALPK